jgi:hypothetical protein
VDGAAQTLKLTDAMFAPEIVIRLWQYGSVSGGVVDEVGEPVVNVTVLLMQHEVADGQRVWRLGDMTLTDDRGFYRFHSVLPARYLVLVPATVTTTPSSVTDEARLFAGSVAASTGAAPQPLGLLAQRGQRSAGIRTGGLDFTVYPLAGELLQPVPAGGLPDAAYASTFYPDARRTDDAVPLVLEAGANRDGVDIRLAMRPTRAITGIVVNAAGQPASFASVDLFQEDLPPPAFQSTTFRTGSTVADRAGRFVLTGVPAGQYRLRASELNGGYAEVPIVAGTTDVADVALTLRRMPVTGHVVFEGKTPLANLSAARNYLVSLSAVGGRQLLAGVRPDENGRFEIPAHPSGRYWLSATPPGPNWTFTAATVNGLDAFSEPIEIAADAIENVIVRFSDARTQFIGTIRGEAAEIDAAMVVAFPADYAARLRRGLNPRLVVTATASKSGEFEVRLPRGGDYYLAVLPADASAELDVATFNALAARAVRLAIKDGERRQITLPFSRPR